MGEGNTDVTPPPVDAATVRQRLSMLRARIAAAGANPDTVEVLAVTKGHPYSVVPVALAAGLVQLGENYAQELVAKATSVGLQAGPGPRWHFIGRLQTNKVRLLAPHVHLWQSLDRSELVAEVARRAPGAHVLIQVNPNVEPGATEPGRAGKGGCAPQQVGELLALSSAAGLVVEGLMTVGPTDADADPRPGFELVRALVDRFGLARCSMGMSEDLEAAVRCGSTMVRVGTALFGPRTRP
ncbi:MAG: YggS family pyridoxal phosphate-dependent enzyme [Acidimicrobiales bacterium]